MKSLVRRLVLLLAATLPLMSAAASSYQKLSELHAAGSAPELNQNSVRAGRCYSESRATSNAVFLISYIRDAKNHLILMGRQLDDGSFTSADNEDLDQPSGFESSVGELQFAIAEIVNSKALNQYEAALLENSWVVSTLNGAKYTYRKTTNGQILLRILRTDGNTEICEFGKKLL